MKRILITDGMDKNAIADLKKYGYDVVEKFYSDEELGAALKDFNVVVVRSATKVREKHLKTALETGNLKLVIRGGVGIDNIDAKFAKDNGISVMNTPGASAPTVAELALAHMFSLARFIADSKQTMCDGKWEKKIYNGIEISGKTLGVVGMGRIGVELSKRAKALGMDVLYYDMRADLDVPGYKKSTMDEILERSDFISLHIPISKGHNQLRARRSCGRDSVDSCT
jgi:D-3-phosphoglycerate dehydrogenase